MSNSREDRERLKEEYKEHYRKMREAKERLNRAKKTRNITEALRNMDTSEVMNSFDDFLYSVKSKIASVEARLEVAMDSLSSEEETGAAGSLKEMERDEELKKEKAKETLRQVKIEMGMLYNEIERHADNIRVEKTIGSGEQHEPEKGNE